MVKLTQAWFTTISSTSNPREGSVIFFLLAGRGSPPGYPGTKGGMGTLATNHLAQVRQVICCQTERLADRRKE
jgi:hypothetical protein